MTEKHKKPAAGPHAKIISRERLYDGFFKLDAVTAEPKSLKHDGYLPKMQREIYIVGNVTCVLLYDPDSDEILLNQQFRMGPLLTGHDPFLLECAAGLIDGDESPEDAARREGLEETGCEIKELEHIGICYPSPGSLDETYYMYAGRIEKPKTGHFGLAHEGEEIKTHLVPALKAIEMADKGEIRNGACLLMLHWFARHRERLRREWRKK